MTAMKDAGTSRDCHAPKVGLNGGCPDGLAVDKAFVACMDEQLGNHSFKHHLDPTNLLRGFYADQLRNFLCAGFHPSQFIILFTNELDNMPRVMSRIAFSLGKTLSSKESDDIARVSSFQYNSKKMAAPEVNHLSEKFKSDMIEFYRPSVLDLRSLLDEHGFHYNHIAFEKEFAPYLQQLSPTMD